MRNRFSNNVDNMSKRLEKKMKNMIDAAIISNEDDIGLVRTRDGNKRFGAFQMSNIVDTNYAGFGINSSSRTVGG